MLRKDRIWFRRFVVVTGYALWRSRAKGKPLQAIETGLAPYSWQGWLIFIATIGLGGGTAELAARFYSIRPVFSWVGWSFFLVIVVTYLYIANKYSDKQ